MSEPFSERILRFIAEPGYRPVKLRRLARLMGIAEEEYGGFRDAADALRRVGRILLGGGNAITLPQSAKRFIGVYRSNPRGFGFVVPENPDAHADLFIPPGQAGDAATGDTVECAIERRGGRDGKMLAGRVVRVLQRGYNRFVGELCHDMGRWYVRPDGHRLHAPIFVADAGAKSARAGDQVVVEIITYPAAGRQATGVIVERLGRRGQTGVDVRSIIREFQLPSEFPPAALEEARRAAAAFAKQEHTADREDLRNEIIVTIDPDDARDFDDAISIRHSPRSTGAIWELGVHIADVSAFVRPGSAMDTEAKRRGNSVYFPRFVIPMLPELLSNGVCSLQEAEPRWCKSAFIQYDADGNVLGTRFANTVIRSAKRLTYREASGILEGHVGGLAPEVIALVRRMDTLARIIQKRRLADGQIVLDLPEIELVLDDEDRVIDARPADTSFSHTIIEMFMLEANEAVARLLEHRHVPFLRRIHPEPDQEDSQTLGRFLRIAGHGVPRRLERADLQKLLANVRGRPEAYAVNLAVLKSMEQAVYSPKKDGHYALASKCYTHFTSPIRRYSDLTIHRSLGALLAEPPGAGRGGRGRPRRAAVESDGEDLVTLGRHLSFTERRAADAERDLKLVKILELLGKHVGETFKGVITGVANFGIFVQHPRFLIDGVARLDQLPDDYWIVDTGAGCVVGQRTRQRLSIGDVVTVEILAADTAARELELRLKTAGRVARRAEPKPTPTPGRRSQRPPRSRRQAKRRGAPRPRGRR